MSSFLDKKLGGPLLAILALGLMAVLEAWLNERRPLAGQVAVAGSVIEVTSGADSGPGSLREAIFTANRAEGRSRIVVLAPAIALRRPLPPLAGPLGVEIEAGPLGVTIDASEIAEASVLDVDAPRSLLRGLSIEHARGSAVLVRAPGVRLEDLAIHDATTGIAAVAGGESLAVVRCRLSENGIGFYLESAALPAVVEDSRFEEHREAAVWAVRAESPVTTTATLMVRGNEFVEDRVGAVLGNLRAEVVDNTFSRPADSALHLFGGGVVARHNQVDEARRFAVVVEGGDATTLVIDNEILSAAAAGILVRSSRGTTVRGNQLAGGAYGIVDVLGDPGRPTIIADNLINSHRLDALVVVAGNPVLRANRVVRNRGAAIRSFDLLDLDGSRTPARALLDGNRFAGNGVDGVVEDLYRVEPPPRQPEPAPGPAPDEEEGEITGSEDATRERSGE